MRIPVEVGDLSAAWFAEVLGAPVAAFQTVASHSGTTGRVRARLRYTGGTEGGAGRDRPEFVFVKLAPFDPRQRRFLDFTGIGVTETRLYAELAATGQLPVRLPGVLHAETDGERFVMILEDLPSSGCRFPSHSDDDLPEMIQSTVQELAGLHAAFWESDRFKTDLSWIPDRAGFGPGGGKDAGAAQAAGGFIRKALEQFAPDMPAVFERVGRLYVERAADILDAWDEGERTLIHGDAHLGNLFVDGHRTGFYDWAMVSHSPGLRDVSYFCCNSVPTVIRREMEEGLLAGYRAALAGHGIHVSERTAWDQYRLFSVFAWVSATSTAAVGSRWQPEAVGRGGMQRATAALEDLDAAGILEERLG